MNITNTICEFFIDVKNRIIEMWHSSSRVSIIGWFIIYIVYAVNFTAWENALVN